MKVFILLLVIWAALFPGAALAQQHPLGDIGKPGDYDQTIRDFTREKRALDALPVSYDWRSSGKVTVAKDQQSCGSCWAFVVAGVLESRILMAGGGSYDLSEQQVLSCNSFGYNCNGGSMNGLAFYYSLGPMQESCTHYPSSSGAVPSPACSTLSACSQLNARTFGYYTVDFTDVAAIKTSLMNDGPAYFRFDVHSDFDTYWNSGAAGSVYVNHANSLLGGHAGLIIGWDDAKAAWLIKNSWGAATGPNHDGTYWMAHAGHAFNLNFGMGSVRATWSGSGGGAVVPALSLPGEIALSFLLVASGFFILRRQKARQETRRKR